MFLKKIVSIDRKALQKNICSDLLGSFREKVSPFRRMKKRSTRRHIRSRYHPVGERKRKEVRVVTSKISQRLAISTSPPRFTSRQYRTTFRILNFAIHPKIVLVEISLTDLRFLARCTSLLYIKEIKLRNQDSVLSRVLSACNLFCKSERRVKYYG